MIIYAQAIWKEFSYDRQNSGGEFKVKTVEMDFT